MGIYCAAQLCVTDHSYSRTGVPSDGSNKDSSNRQNKVTKASFSLYCDLYSESSVTFSWHETKNEYMLKLVIF